MGTNADSGYCRAMVPATVLGNSSGPEVTMAPGGSTGHPDQYGLSKMDPQTTNVATGGSPGPVYPCDLWQQHRPQRPWFWYDHRPSHGSLQQPGPLDVTMAPGGSPGHSDLHGPQTVMWPQAAAQAPDTDIGMAFGGNRSQRHQHGPWLL